MYDVRLLLIIVGCLAVVGLLIHGFILSRKENSKIFQENCESSNSVNSTKGASTDTTTLPPLEESIGEVVVKKRVEDEKEDTKKYQMLKESNVRVSYASRKLIDPTKEESDNEISNTSDLKKTPSKVSNLEDRESKIIALHVTAKHSSAFLDGNLLYESIRVLVFKFGEMNIFHKYKHSISGNNEIVFSLVNIVKPGHFDLDNIDKLKTPGVSLFMILQKHDKPQGLDVKYALQDFNAMLQASYKLATLVKGVVKDDKHKLITPLKAEEYKTCIREFFKKKDYRI